MSYRHSHQSHPYFFQVPQTPSAPSAQWRDGISRSDSGRSLLLHQIPSQQHSVSKSFRASPFSSLENSMTSSGDVVSPAPLVNLKYDLAGGVDSSAAKNDIVMEDDVDSNKYDISFRRGRGAVGSFANPYKSSIGEYFPPLPTALAHEGNGRKRSHAEIDEPGNSSWGSFVFNVVGEVAGKLWGLCRTNPFRGFYSGGGNNHSATRSRGGSLNMEGSWYHIQDIDMQGAGASAPQPLTHMKRTQYEQQQNDTPVRPSKRQQTRKASDNSLSASWVMVSSMNRQRSASQASIANSTRKSSALQHAEGRARRSSLAKLSSNSPCRPFLPASRPSFVSQASAPAFISGSSASVASPRSYDASHANCPTRPTRSSSSTSIQQQTSPFSPETLRFAAKRRKREQDMNTSFRNVNRQLRNMISEGREALASFPS